MDFPTRTSTYGSGRHAKKGEGGGTAEEFPWLNFRPLRKFRQLREGKSPRVHRLAIRGRDLFYELMNWFTPINHSRGSLYTRQMNSRRGGIFERLPRSREYQGRFFDGLPLAARPRFLHIDKPLSFSFSFARSLARASRGEK